MSGTEFARQHPEYVCFNRDGTAYGGLETETLRLLKRFYAEYPASLTDAGLMKALDSAPLGEGLDLVLVNCKDIHVVDYAARGLIKGRDFFGYDGVRFDGHYIVGGGGDPLAPASQVLDYSGQSLNTRDADELTARNMRYAIDLIRKQYPDFIFGYNTGITGTAAGAASREAATIVPGSYILDEGVSAALDATEPRNVWSVYAKSAAAEVDRVRHLNGYLFCGWFNVIKQPVLGKLLKAVGWAAGTRTITNIDSTDLQWLHDYNRFCYRYSEYILNNNLQRVPSEEAGKLVQVKSVRPVFYQDFVQKMEDRNGRYLVVHLINSPMEERIVKNGRIPPQAEGVSVTLSPELFSGRKPDPASIRALSPDTTPQVQPVVSKQEGGKMTITVPEFCLLDRACHSLLRYNPNQEAVMRRPLLCLYVMIAAMLGLAVTSRSQEVKPSALPWGPNLCPNNSFEDVDADTRPAGWTFVHRGQEGIFKYSATDEGCAGKRCLAMSIAPYTFPAGEEPYYTGSADVISPVIPAEEGWYIVSFWIKADFGAGKKAPAGSGSGVFYVDHYAGQTRLGTELEDYIWLPSWDTVTGQWKNVFQVTRQRPGTTGIGFTMQFGPNPKVSYRVLVDAVQIRRLLPPQMDKPLSVNKITDSDYGCITVQDPDSTTGIAYKVVPGQVTAGAKIIGWYTED